VALRLGAGNDTGISRTSAGSGGSWEWNSGGRQRSGGAFAVAGFGSCGGFGQYGACGRIRPNYGNVFDCQHSSWRSPLPLATGTGWQFDFVKRIGGVRHFCFLFWIREVVQAGTRAAFRRAAQARLHFRRPRTRSWARTTTDTLTNKTIDAEATGNNITQPTRLWFPAAGCQNAAPTGYWDMGTATIPSAVCATGTNVVKGLLRVYGDGPERAVPLSDAF